MVLLVPTQFFLVGEFEATPVGVARVPLAPVVRELVIAQVMGGRERPPTLVKETLVGTLPRVRPLVFLQVTFRRELFWTSLVITIKRLSCVNPLVGRETVLGIKGLVAALLLAVIGTLPRMDPLVYLETVGGKERLLAAVVIAFVVVATFVCSEVGPQVGT